MEQKSLARWLKVILFGVAICGAVVYLGILPMLGLELADTYPECSGWILPWLIFLWLSGIPCYGVLGISWRIVSNIGQDRSFSQVNARLLWKISLLAAGDTGFFFVGNVLFLFWGRNHPGVVLFSLFVVFAGIAVAIVTASLSHLVKKAAKLQEQSDLTI